MCMYIYIHIINIYQHYDICICLKMGWVPSLDCLCFKREHDELCKVVTQYKKY